MSLHTMTLTVAFDDEGVDENYLRDAGKYMSDMMHEYQGGELNVLRWHVASVSSIGGVG